MILITLQDHTFHNREVELPLGATTSTTWLIRDTFHPQVENGTEEDRKGANAMPPADHTPSPYTGFAIDVWDGERGMLRPASGNVSVSRPFGDINQPSQML